MEYTTLATMKHHPNLLALIGGVVSGAQVWMVFSYIPGGSLAARLQQDPSFGRTDLLRTLNIAIGIACGLAALHAQGYLHRDCTIGYVLLLYFHIILLESVYSLIAFQWPVEMLCLTCCSTSNCAISASRVSCT